MTIEEVLVDAAGGDGAVVLTTPFPLLDRLRIKSESAATFAFLAPLEQTLVYPLLTHAVDRDVEQQGTE